MLWHTGKLMDCWRQMELYQSLPLVWVTLGEMQPNLPISQMSRCPQVGLWWAFWKETMCVKHLTWCLAHCKWKEGSWQVSAPSATSGHGAKACWGGAALALPGRLCPVLLSARCMSWASWPGVQKYVTGAFSKPRAAWKFLNLRWHDATDLDAGDGQGRASAEPGSLKGNGVEPRPLLSPETALTSLFCSHYLFWYTGEGEARVERLFYSSPPHLWRVRLCQGTFKPSCILNKPVFIEDLLGAHILLNLPGVFMYMRRKQQSVARHIGIESWLYPLLTVWFGTIYLTSKSSSFLTYKMRIIIPTLKD